MSADAVPTPFGDPVGQGAADGFALTPLQMGMLYQALREGENGAGYDIEQIHFALPEVIDADFFGAAWALVAQTHAVLSVHFSWQGLPVPCQVADPDVVVPVHVEDWSALSEKERAARRAAFLREDRARGFELDRGPLLRVAVFATADGQSEVVWTVHHAIVDGRSFPIVLRDVFDAYDALRAGREPHLATPAVSYRDFVRWLSTRNGEPSRAFFRTLLGDQRMPTPLPGAEPNPRGESAATYVEAAAALPADVMVRLRSRAEREGVPLGSLVAAAWAIVLHRYTRESTVLFGATRHGRRTALDGQAAGMVGLFINTLPFRVRLAADDSVSSLLVELASQTAALRPHEHTPLHDVQSQSGVPRNRPLFESLLTFETRGLDATLRGTGEPRWQRARFALHEKPAFPLNVLVEADDELGVRLLFDPRRIGAEAGDRLLGSLCFVFEQLANEARERIGDIEVVTPDEREKILNTWNATSWPLPPSLLLHALFEAQVARKPDDIAVQSGSEQVSYRELYRRARALSHALRERGAKTSTFVGVCVGRDTELVVSLLGVMLSGAAYVPLDAREPPARLVSMLDDAKASLVVASAHNRELFADREVVEAGSALSAPPDGVFPGHEAKDTDPCYAIFTSGSTGKPNGAVLTHRAVVNTLDWVNRTFQVGPSDRVLFVNSPAFDLSVYDLFGIFAAGGTVVIANERQLADPAELLRMLREERITIWNSTPGAWQRVLGQLTGSAPEAALRLVLLSGDWIPVPLPDATRRAFPRARVVSLGGATEAAIWSNFFPIEHVDPAWTSIPYGRPIQNARYHALDERRKPVPVGAVGDLYIGGLCVAQGYLNRPELNAERFVPDPFAPLTHPSHLYKTGDLVRYFSDGNLEFLGRADFQVKIRGFRVELGELDMALLGVAEVREAVSIARVDASGEKSLIGYVVLHPGAGLDEARVKTAISKTVPPFMMPSRVVFLDALPLSSNGKVDRKALPEPRALAQDRAFTAPRDEDERRLVKLWEELLEREPIGVTDDFFDVGGHSLLALTLVGRCRTELGLGISLPRFLEHPTIEGILESAGKSAEPTQVSRHFFTHNGAGRRPPLVLLGGGNYALLYREFPKVFDEDQPVHFAQVSTGDAEGADAVAALVEGDVLAACPAGPIVVGGLGAGARVALALARRLRAQGRSVPLLLSIDAREPEFSPPRLSERLLRAGSRLRARVRSRLEGDAGREPPLGAALLMITADATSFGNAAAELAADFRRQVSGAVEVIRVPGEHMSFLADGRHGTVVSAIAARIDRLMRQGSGSVG